MKTTIYELIKKYGEYNIPYKKAKESNLLETYWNISYSDFMNILNEEINNEYGISYWGLNTIFEMKFGNIKVGVEVDDIDEYGYMDVLLWYNLENSNILSDYGNYKYEHIECHISMIENKKEFEDIIFISMSKYIEINDLHWIGFDFYKFMQK